MKKIFCLLLLLLLLVTGCGQDSGGKDAAAVGSYTVTDEHGTVTTFKQAPQKVLTLALSSDGVQEIAHAAYGEAFAMQGAQHLRVK